MNIANVENLNDQLYGAPAGVLIMVFSICLGYLLKTIPVVPNKYIPAIVVAFCTVTFMLIAPPRDASIELRIWLVRNFIIGFITGFLAWAFHAQILRRFVDPKFFNDDGSTKFFTKPTSPPSNPPTTKP